MNLLEPRPMGSFTASGLGLGTARLGAFWQGKNVDEGLTAVRSAVDLGVTLIDTADVYARGLSERIVGKAIGKREGVVVMTKVGLLKTPVGLARAARASGRLPGPSGLKAAAAADTCFESSYVRAAAQACLRRQKRDRLDVLLLHEPDAATLAVRPFDDAVARLRRDGDVIDFGVSVRTKEAALAALDIPEVSWLQIPVNVNNTEIAKAVATHPRAGDVVILAIGVLGDGTLLSSDANRSALERVPELIERAVRLPGIDGALLGMSTPQHVTGNLAALKQHELRRDRGAVQ